MHISNKNGMNHQRQADNMYFGHLETPCLMNRDEQGTSCRGLGCGTADLGDTGVQFRSSEKMPTVVGVEAHPKRSKRKSEVVMV